MEKYEELDKKAFEVLKLSEMINVRGGDGEGSETVPTPPPPPLPPPPGGGG